MAFAFFIIVQAIILTDDDERGRQQNQKKIPSFIVLCVFADLVPEDPDPSRLRRTQAQNCVRVCCTHIAVGEKERRSFYFIFIPPTEQKKTIREETVLEHTWCGAMIAAPTPATQEIAEVCGGRTIKKWRSCILRTQTIADDDDEKKSKSQGQERVRGERKRIVESERDEGRRSAVLCCLIYITGLPAVLFRWLAHTSNSEHTHPHDRKLIEAGFIDVCFLLLKFSELGAYFDIKWYFLNKIYFRNKMIKHFKNNPTQPIEFSITHRLNMCVCGLKSFSKKPHREYHAKKKARSYSLPESVWVFASVPYTAAAAACKHISHLCRCRRQRDRSENCRWSQNVEGSVGRLSSSFL